MFFNHIGKEKIALLYKNIMRQRKLQYYSCWYENISWRNCKKYQPEEDVETVRAMRNKYGDSGGDYITTTVSILNMSMKKLIVTESHIKLMMILILILGYKR